MHWPQPSRIHARVRRRTKRALRAFLAVAFLTVSTVRADAQFLDGDTLHDWYMLSSQASGGPAQHRACIPDIEANQAVSTVKQYLRVHPRTDVAAGSDLVAPALSDAFPCP